MRGFTQLHFDRHFSEAISRWFKGLGEFPKFKIKKDSDSFTVDAADWNHAVLWERQKPVKNPNLGTFRLKESLPFQCMAQTLTISRTADKWYVSFAIKAQKIPPLGHLVATPTGIGLGVSTFATLSDGNFYESPRPLKKTKTLRWVKNSREIGKKC